MFKKLSDFILTKITTWLTRDIHPLRSLPLSDFGKIQSIIEPGDVLLIEGRSRVSQVIKIITQSPWSHAALYIGRLHNIKHPILRDYVKQYIESHFHGDEETQLIVESILGKGVIITPLEHYKDEHIRLCRPIGLAREDAQKITNYSLSKLGLEYDVKQILDLARFLFPWQILPKHWRSNLFAHNARAPTRMSCSLLIAEAFMSVQFPILPLIRPIQSGGLELIQRNPKLYTPCDFDYSPFFAIIKYPIVELFGEPGYRRLPWNTSGILSNDKEELYIPNNQEDSLT